MTEVKPKVKVDRRTSAHRAAAKAAIRLAVLNLQDLLKDMTENPEFLPTSQDAAAATQPLSGLVEAPADDENDGPDTDD